jgi:tetratricopeptide (TPR) repeat protein
MRKAPDDRTGWLDHLAGAVRIAFICNRLDLARRWIEKARKRIRNLEDRPLKEALEPELDLLALWAQFYEDGPLQIDRRLERAFTRIVNWKPWMLHVHWLFLLNRHRLDQFDDLIRNHPHGRISKGTLEYGLRLECLGIRFSIDNRASQAKTVLQSALRMLNAVSSPERLYSRATALTWLARAVDETGGSSKALELLRHADAVARRFKSLKLRYDINNTRGTIHYNRGEYQEALRSYLDTCFYPTAKNHFHLTKAALALLYGARCALKLGSLSQARRLIGRAQPMARACPYPALRGFIQLLRGDLERESGTPSGFRKARALYASAEKIFQDFGTGQKWWLGLVYLSRGMLYLKEKNIAEALRHSSVSLELGMKDRAVDIQAESLLLKSHLLLHEEAPRLDIYEGILRQMGLVRDPVVMFKILANLYIYSWDLDEHIELTDLHLKQLSGLKEVLPQETYDRLYRVHVTERVVARFRRRFNGEEPGRRAAAE